jgi:hypothetical protein
MENDNNRIKMVLENSTGKAVRFFILDGDKGTVIRRSDTRRVEIHKDLDALDESQVRYQTIGQLSRAELELAPFEFGDNATIRMINSSNEEDVLKNEKLSQKSNKVWYSVFLSLLIFNALFLSFISKRSIQTAVMEQELKQQVVQIVKRMPIRPQPTTVQANQSNSKVQPENQPRVTAKRVDAIKRLGALAAFGSLKNSSQRGGVNLGAVNSTAGPGLGGTGGSGGVQTTLYGKGLVSAPLGAGANMQGGGGYGTKGKGGGQAGYGKLSLIGSAGANPIPLGKEAIIAGGLDSDLINDVINRNIGQVRFCYEQGLQGDPGLNGRVAVNFTIGGNGQVMLAGIGNTTLNSKLVEDCIVMRLRSWKFPLPEGGSEVKVSYPFVLRRTGKG